MLGFPKTSIPLDEAMGQNFKKNESCKSWKRDVKLSLFADDCSPGKPKEPSEKLFPRVRGFSKMVL